MASKQNQTDTALADSQVADIQKALIEADNGEFATDEQVASFKEKWLK